MSEFDSWYEPGGTGSGIGSTPVYTAGYRLWLEAFMAEHDVHSVLDVGCGDWQFSRLVRWGERMYVGQEVVPALAKRLQAEYGGDRRAFVSTPPVSLTFDLVIVKDVMIHLPNAEVVDLLARIAHHRHLLLVNDYAPPPNADCERGSYRALDVTAAPFNVNARIVYTFPRLNNEHKVVHHRGPG